MEWKLGWPNAEVDEEPILITSLSDLAEWGRTNRKLNEKFQLLITGQFASELLIPILWHFVLQDPKTMKTQNDNPLSLGVVYLAAVCIWATFPVHSSEKSVVWDNLTNLDS